MLHMLSQQGFAVLVAGTAYEALNILRQRPVDLLLTDIIMPGMDGVDLAKEARKLHAGLKVLFATAYMQVALKRAAAHHGPVLYKPFRDGELIKAVNVAAADAVTRARAAAIDAAPPYPDSLPAGRGRRGARSRCVPTPRRSRGSCGPRRAPRQRWRGPRTSRPNSADGGGPSCR